MENRQIHQEVKWALGLTLLYILGWGGCAYFLPNHRGLLGFPLWFEMACLFVPMVFILLITWVVKTRFKEIELGGKE